MSSAVLSFDPRYAGGGYSRSRGVSQSAMHVASLVKRGLDDAWRTVSGRPAGLAALPELHERYRDAQAQAQHDDERAFPSPAAMQEANELLISLPSWCPIPSPVIEPSGAIALEWDLGPNRWMVLAFKGTGTIELSAILGLGNEFHGKTSFAGVLGAREHQLLGELVELRV